MLLKYEPASREKKVSKIVSVKTETSHTNDWIQNILYSIKDDHERQNITYKTDLHLNAIPNNY